MTPPLGWVFFALYAAVLSCLCVFGLVAYALVVARLRLPTPPQPLPLPDYPTVTVQLPVRNERYVLSRLVHAVAALDWPRDRLEIQILDDSDDDTRGLAQDAVADLCARGFHAVVSWRSQPTGHKAGALREGLAQARGEFIAIFDADFVPTPSFLRELMPSLADPTVACAQARWGHVNRGYSWLTRAVSLGIDGHFLVEQSVRSRAGLLLNFNGTAGIWRKAAILDAGNWSSATLAEDLDLSYRAQLRGWRIVYREDVVAPAEIPAQVQAFRRQQARWAQGSIQCARKHLGAVLRSERIRPTAKGAAVLHLTHYLMHPLLVLLALLMPFAMLLHGIPWPLTLLYFCGTFGPWTMYALALRLDRNAHLPRRTLGQLTFLGVGLSVSNTAAVLRGLLRDGGTFRRTPKFRIEGVRDTWTDKAYALPLDWMLAAEAFMALWAAATTLVAWRTHHFLLLPWGLLFCTSYTTMVAVSLRHRAHPPTAQEAALASPAP